MQDPSRGKGASLSPFPSAAAVLQLRLLDVYLSLPQANAFASDHEGLIRLCARAFRGSSPSSASIGAAQAVFLFRADFRKDIEVSTFCIGVLTEWPLDPLTCGHRCTLRQLTVDTSQCSTLFSGHSSRGQCLAFSSLFFTHLEMYGSTPSGGGHFALEGSGII